MTHKEKYKVYCRMFNNTNVLSEIIVDAMNKSDTYKVLSDCFVAVANEEKELYFVDIEYLFMGNYKRVYSTMTETQITKWVNNMN